MHVSHATLACDLSASTVTVIPLVSAATSWRSRTQPAGSKVGLLSHHCGLILPVGVPDGSPATPERDVATFLRAAGGALLNAPLTATCSRPLPVQHMVDATSSAINGFVGLIIDALSCQDLHGTFNLYVEGSPSCGVMPTVTGHNGAYQRGPPSVQTVGSSVHSVRHRHRCARVCGVPAN
jgi:hypothetical protein